MKKETITLDIPVDFIAGDNIPGNMIARYLNIPCEMEAVFFAICVKGTINLTVNLRECIIKPFDFVVLTSGSIVRIDRLSSDAHFYYACFSRRFMDNNNLLLTSIHMFPSLAENPVISLTQDFAQLFMDVFKPLIHVYSFPCTLENKDLIKSIFTIFMQGTTELYKNNGKWKDSPRTRSKELCREFVKLVMTHYHTQRNVTFYAETLGISTTHFCSIVKKETGKTALEIIVAIVIADMKAQLKSTDLSIKEIAFSLGFNNMSFFNRYFKRYMHMTPLEYRNS